MAKQLSFKGVGGWGGKRRGAGRPNTSGKLNHKRRPRVDYKKPLHITHKLNRRLPSLRRKASLMIFRKAAKRAQKFGLSVLQYSLQSDHFHLMVEARDNKALANGMRAISNSIAKSLNKFLQRTGAVFKDRFHLNLLSNPTQVRNALRYILLNHEHHAKRAVKFVDSFSSAAAFEFWEKLKRVDLKGKSVILEELGSPRSWLAKVGWMRAC